MKLLLVIASLLLSSCAQLPPAVLTKACTTNCNFDTLKTVTLSKRISILQGATSDSTTQLSLLYPKGEPMAATLWDAKGKTITPSEVRDHVFPGIEWRVTQLRFKGLDKSVEYWLQVANKAGDLVDLRSLKTLDTKNPTPTFAVASCMDDAYVSEQAGMWNDMLSAKPDLIFLIGDNVYADRRMKSGKYADPPTLWNRYIETRNILDLYKTQALVPVFATWDDHDFGWDDGDSSYPYKKEAKNTFVAFFPQEPIPGFYERGPGVSSYFKAFGQQFALIDDRSFRTAPKEAKGQTHWGREQEDWIFRRLARSKSPAWLMEGDQFFGGYHSFESYEGRHPESFKKFTKRMKQTKTPIILVSGDRHLTELMQLSKEDVGYETYELTTSPMHAITFPDPWKETPNPRKIEGVAGTNNYMIVKGKGANPFSFNVTAMGPSKKVLYSRDLRVKR